MSKYNSISIRDAMNNVASNQYLLPAIQRKFVWESEQIEMLFDSIMRNYPINSFMLWKITDQNIKKNYKFYQFIKDFAKKFHEDNLDAPSKLLTNDFYAVIDGQQRMTSLYIGLIGTYRDKKPGVWWKDTEDNMPTKTLYLDLSSPLTSMLDNAKLYDFSFMSLEEIKVDQKKNPEKYWFPVGEVLGFKELSDVTDYLINNGLIANKYAMSTLSNLFNKINKEDIINYYVIEEQDQDKVLDVFIRTNRGGTSLSFSDLLMSIASANWSKYDARKEMKDIRDTIYSYGNPNFDVSQDFILKSILVLSDVDIRFKLDNFGRDNIEIFEEKWDCIKKSLQATFDLLKQLGFNDRILRAKNAAIPIAYYIYRNELYDSITKTTYDPDDKKNIAKWLSMSLLKGLFGGQSDNILTSLRTIIGNEKGKFPIQKIFDEFKGNVDKNYTFSEDVIESFLEEEYGSATCSLTLLLLYPDVVLEHGNAIAQDHMHPKTMFEDLEKLHSLGLSADQESFFTNRKNYNSVLNLQLLEEVKNKSKNDDSLANWAKANSKSNADLYLEENTDLDIKQFEAFIEVRKKQLTAKLKSILEV